MDAEAAIEEGKTQWGNHPRLQILTIAELLEGARIDYPPTLKVTHKRAPRHLPEPASQHALSLTDDDPEPTSPTVVIGVVEVDPASLRPKASPARKKK